MASAVEFVGFDHQITNSPNANVSDNNPDIQQPPAFDQQVDSSAHALSPELYAYLMRELKCSNEQLRIALHDIDELKRGFSHLEKVVRYFEQGLQSLSAAFDAAKPAIEWCKSLWSAAKHPSWPVLLGAWLISLATSDTMTNPQPTPPDQECAKTTTHQEAECAKTTTPPEQQCTGAVTDHKEEQEIKMFSQPKRTIFVRLIVEPEALAQGHVKQLWLDSAKDHIKSNADKNEKTEVTVEIKSDSTHEAFCKSQTQESPLSEWDPIAEAPAADSSVVTFLVIPAKQDREPFPKDCNMLQMGYLVQDRGDCDSIWIGSEFSGGVIDAVDANRKTRCYDGPAAWDKIMRKILQ